MRRWLRGGRHNNERYWPVLDDIRTMPREELLAAIGSYFWWHSIDLGGITTPGQKTPEVMAGEFRQTFDGVDLRGKSVLDIGAWNGGFAVEARRRGAARVVALDHYTWNHPHFKGRETFEIVCRALGMEIEAVDIDLNQHPLNLAPLGRFDIVLFLGVFYHLRDPLAALGQIVPLVRERLIVETHIEQSPDPRPLMIFYPGDELAGDPTNWWGPNTACMTELLKAAGFGRIDILPFTGRQVFHAHRAG